MILEIPVEAPTLNDYFERFKRSGSPQTWRDYWLDLYTERIDYCLKMGWFVFPLPKHSKVPFGKFSWGNTNWRRETLLENGRTGGNTAVVAGLSTGKKLVIVDCDAVLGLDDYPQTVTMRTTRGLQFYTTEPFDERLGLMLKEKYPDIDSFRTSIMYALVPLSVTCKNDAGAGCSEKGHHHDYRVRDWLYRGRLMSFKTFAKEMLK